MKRGLENVYRMCENERAVAVLRVSETYNITEKGVTKIKKRIVKNIGPLPIDASMA